VYIVGYGTHIILQYQVTYGPESNKILSDMQFGFRQCHSAELQLLQTMHDLSLNLNGRSQTDLDFGKALDKVPHRHLLLMLNY